MPWLVLGRSRESDTRPHDRTRRRTGLTAKEDGRQRRVFLVFLLSVVWALGRLGRQERRRSRPASPEQYVDCGITRRDFAYRGERRVYEYNVASSSKYKFATLMYPPVNATVLAEIARTTNLESRANVYVAPTSTGALVSANAKFVLSIVLQGMAYKFNGLGTLLDQEPMSPIPSPSVTLTTLETGSGSWADTAVNLPIARYSREAIVGLREAQCRGPAMKSGDLICAWLPRSATTSAGE